jgi:hypothetical protein
MLAWKMSLAKAGEKKRRKPLLATHHLSIGSIFFFTVLTSTTNYYMKLLNQPELTFDLFTMEDYERSRFLLAPENALAFLRDIMPDARVNISALPPQQPSISNVCSHAFSDLQQWFSDEWVRGTSGSKITDNPWADQNLNVGSSDAVESQLHSIPWWDEVVGSSDTVERKSPDKPWCDQDVGSSDAAERKVPDYPWMDQEDEWSSVASVSTSSTIHSDEFNNSKIPFVIESDGFSSEIPKEIFTPKMNAQSHVALVGLYILRVGNIPEGRHTEFAMCLIKEIGKFGMELYGRDASLEGKCTWVAKDDNTIDVVLHRWIDMHLGCAIKPPRLSMTTMVEHDDFSTDFQLVEELVTQASWREHFQPDRTLVVTASAHCPTVKLKEYLYANIGDLIWTFKSLKAPNGAFYHLVTMEDLENVGKAVARLDGTSVRKGCILTVRPFCNWEDYHCVIKKRHLKTEAHAKSKHHKRNSKPKRKAKKDSKSCKKA